MNGLNQRIIKVFYKKPDKQTQELYERDLSIFKDVLNGETYLSVALRWDIVPETVRQRVFSMFRKTKFSIYRAYPGSSDYRKKTNIPDDLTLAVGCQSIKDYRENKDIWFKLVGTN